MNIYEAIASCAYAAAIVIIIWIYANYMKGRG